EAPERVFHATDLSADALVVARENVEEHGVTVALTHGDLFAGLKGPFALVVSNPPYVTDAEVETLEPEVARHEPRMALVGGTDGLDVVRRLAVEAHARLLPGGALLIEIGSEQGAATADVLRRAGFVDVRVIADLAGRDRVVEGWR
ncbi:MAG: peptide chain release factor N(5)-glutamine methyltransferase, partial [Myxococcales bacterium]|nr:peptide chain release factor N(5)-glutamine methyltransferase [Myxococcales bacterium]